MLSYITTAQTVAISKTTTKQLTVFREMSFKCTRQSATKIKQAIKKGE